MIGAALFSFLHEEPNFERVHFLAARTETWVLTKRYMASVRNLPEIMKKIVEGTAPEKFSVQHLKGIGFSSSNDRAVIPLLKDLGFLSASGVPTKRYHDYRDPARSKQVLGEAMKEAYEEIFHINAKPTKSDRKAIEGRFKSAHNVTDKISKLQAMTFFAFLDLADLTSAPKTPKEPSKETEKVKQPPTPAPHIAPPPGMLSLRYNVEIHLPASKDVEVYNAIFRSLKEHLVE